MVLEESHIVGLTSTVIDLQGSSDDQRLYAYLIFLMYAASISASLEFNPNRLASCSRNRLDLDRRLQHETDQIRR